MCNGIKLSTSDLILIHNLLEREIQDMSKELHHPWLKDRKRLQEYIDDEIEDRYLN